MTKAELLEMLKDPEVRKALRDLLVSMALREDFADYPGLGLPGSRRPNSVRVLRTSRIEGGGLTPNDFR